MILITFVATAVLVYVAIAAFAYHDSYEARASHQTDEEYAGSRELSDEPTSRGFFRLVVAGAIITCGAAMVAQAILVEFGTVGASRVFSHAMFDWVVGIVLVVVGIAVLARPRSNRPRGNPNTHPRSQG